MRFDCAEMESPLREILYETDCWMKQEPTGLRDLELPRETSEREVGIGEFIMYTQETGDRATYVHSRLVGSELSKGGSLCYF